MSPGRHDLRGRLLEVIGRGALEPLDDEVFGRLALGVFAHQFAHNAPYRAYCESRGATPATVTGWEEIPAVPTDAFKAAPLVCGDPAEARAIFRTSGTTRGQERRGSHYFLDLTLYEAALRAGFAAHLLPEGGRRRILSLVPPPADQPDSSLSHMISTVVDSFGTAQSGWFLDPGAGLDLEGVRKALRSAEREDEPVLVLGTSLAFLHLFDHLGARAESFRLAPGSRAMDTGGFKGRSREVSREDLLSLFGARLGLPAADVVNEYGMTEMSSQLYAHGATPHRAPGWVRSRAVDPETLAPLPPGELGVLRHWDLANLDSVMVLQTADLGRVGPAGVEVVGRARGAEARGCSLAVEELLSAIGDG